MKTLLITTTAAALLALSSAPAPAVADCWMRAGGTTCQPGGPSIVTISADGQDITTMGSGAILTITRQFLKDHTVIVPEGYTITEVDADSWVVARATPYLVRVTVSGAPNDGGVMHADITPPGSSNTK